MIGKPVYNFNCNELCHKKKLIDSLLKYYKPFEYNKINIYVLILYD